MDPQTRASATPGASPPAADRPWQHLLDAAAASNYRQSHVAPMSRKEKRQHARAQALAERAAANARQAAAQQTDSTEPSGAESASSDAQRLEDAAEPDGRGPAEADGPTTAAAPADQSPPLLTASGEGDGRESADEPAQNGDEVLAELRSVIAKFVVLPDEQALTAVTLWVAATHLQPVWQHAPRLAVVGPAKRCGKSRLLDVITETVHDPVITVNASPAAIFRSIGEKEPPTLLVDEADTLFGTLKMAEKNEELRGLLNAGHQRNRPTLRASGPENGVQKFATFAMAALAGIGDLPDTIMDRAVVIRMRRRGQGEKVSDFRSSRDIPPLHQLRGHLARWMRAQRKDAASYAPTMPVADRAADTWEPLVAVADLAGGAWPTLARSACKTMCEREAGRDEDGGLKTRILVDIRAAFAQHDDPEALSTATLLRTLKADPEAPWAEYGTGGLSPRGLQLLLRDYSISSANRRFRDGSQAKGFTRAQFVDAWDRYTPTSPQPAQEPTAATEPIPIVRQPSPPPPPALLSRPPAPPPKQTGGAGSACGR